MKVIFLKGIFLFYLMMPLEILSKDNDSLATNSTSYSFEPGFRSFQVDVASLIFVNDMGVSLDFDLIKMNVLKTSGIGLRLAYEKYTKSDIGGGHFGTPYYFATLYSRFTKVIKKVQIDLYPGISYGTKSEANSSEFVFRMGMDIKYMIFTDIFGVLIKLKGRNFANGTFIGFGFYLGLGNTNI